MAADFCVSTLTRFSFVTFLKSPKMRSFCWAVCLENTSKFFLASAANPHVLSRDVSLLNVFVTNCDDAEVQDGTGDDDDQLPGSFLSCRTFDERPVRLVLATAESFVLSSCDDDVLLELDVSESELLDEVEPDDDEPSSSSSSLLEYESDDVSDSWDFLLFDTRPFVLVECDVEPPPPVDVVGDTLVRSLLNAE